MISQTFLRFVVAAASPAGVGRLFMAEVIKPQPTSEVQSAEEQFGG